MIYEALKHLPFVVISALDAETSALGAETSALGARTSAFTQSFQQYQHGVSGNIGNCSVGITP